MCALFLFVAPPVKKLVSEENGKEEKDRRILEIPWVPDVPSGDISVKRKEVSRERKQKWVFKYSNEDRSDRLLGMCAKRLGSKATVEVFGHLGRETGLKEYNKLIQLCVKKARGADDEDIAIEEMGKVFQLFKSMTEQGLKLEEQTYRPLLLYVIDMHMVEEFQFFCHVIKEENPSSVTRLGYYELMLWLRVNNEEKIQGIYNYIAENDGQDPSNLRGG